VACSSVGSSV